MATLSNWPKPFLRLALLLPFLAGSPAREACAAVVINEIHYHPNPPAEPAGFVELYNSGSQPVDLSGWFFSSGIQFQFPAKTILAPESYLVLAQDTNLFQRRFRTQPFGRFDGKLSHKGEKLILKDQKGDVRNEVDYKAGFPWPTVGDAGSGASIELIHPDLDNNLGGNWRSSAQSQKKGPTPGARNSAFNTNPPPSIVRVRHFPEKPRSAEPVQISLTAAQGEGIASLTLNYQVVEPGNYIELKDAAFQKNWTSVPMEKESRTQPAGSRGEGVFVAAIPASVQKHRRLIRYRITGQDRSGGKVAAPYADDSQPNFAYFVYDGVPAWRGAIHPGSAQRGTPVEYGTNIMRSLPVYHLIAKKQSVERATWYERSGGHEYNAWGSLVYDGKVYDHIRYRARGGSWRYAMGKNMWKFDFNAGHDFEARDNYGEKYGERWTKLNLGACIQQSDYGHRGEQGMFESVGFRLFNLAGIEAPNTHFVQFRVIDTPEEYKNQYEGDFWGLYLAVEEMNGRFLDEHHLADGNLYKMEGGDGKLSHQGAGQVKDSSDLHAFMNAYQRSNPSDDWWRKNLDLTRYYNYRSIVECIHHYDIDEGPGKNYYYLYNPQTRRWSVHPWDIDLTWADSMYGNGQSPFYRRVLRRPAVQLEFKNRLREIRDLLFNSDQTGQLIDEYARMISDPAGGVSMVGADRAMWDFNPVMSDPRRSMFGKAGPGQFYRAASTHDFSGMVALMKKYVVTRGQWIDRQLIADPLIPKTPEIKSPGRKSLRPQEMKFESSAFDGQEKFAAIQWRIGEIGRPGVSAKGKPVPGRYEIDAVWESGELSNPAWTIQVPEKSVSVGRTYRVRVRMKDSTGRWSHWSAPAEFSTAN